MADIELDDGRDRGDRRDRVEAEPVAGMAFEPDRLGMRRSAHDPRQLVFSGGAFGVAIAAGMQLDHRRADRLAASSCAGSGR